MPDPNEITIVGRSPGGYYYDLYGFTSTQAYLESQNMVSATNTENYQQSAGKIFLNQHGDNEIHTIVNGQLTGDGTKDADIKDASMNVARGLARTEDAWNHTPGSLVVAWDKKQETVSEALADIHNTKFIVGDFQTFGLRIKAWDKRSAAPTANQMWTT